MKGYHTTLFFALYWAFLIFSGTLWGMLVCAVIAWAVTFPIQRFISNRRLPVPVRGAVLITGCSSGIGQETSTYLANQGFTVFASVRKQSDGKKLQQLAAEKYGVGTAQKIIPVTMDVTKQDEIEQCVSTVEYHLQDRELRFLSVINNAGYGETAPLEVLPVEKLRKNFDVNVMGVVAVTQAFLPLLRKHNDNNHRGRVIFLGSGIGLISVPTVGSYCATKAALEAIVDAWRVELKAWNLHVVDIISGRVGSEFGKKAQASGEENVLENDQIAKKIGRDVLETYKEEVKRMKFGESLTPYSDVSRVAKTIENALRDSSPYPRYFPAPDVSLLLPLALSWPEGITDTIFDACFRWFRGSAKTGTKPTNLSHQQQQIRQPIS